MIAKLRGIIDTIGEDFCIVDVNGVGYLVFALAKTLGRLSRGQEAALRIETVVREDSIRCLVSTTPGKKNGLRRLPRFRASAPRSASAFCRRCRRVSCRRRLRRRTKPRLRRANGVGPKLAARIVTELKDKIVTIPMSAETNDFAKGMDMDANEETAAYEDRLEARAEDPNLMEDAISALVNLGYQRLEAYRAVSKAMAEGQAEDVSSLIRLALKEFANKEI